MAAAHLELPQQAIAAFCRKWNIVEMSLFGSVLRDDFRPDSDIDVLVVFAEDAGWDLWNLIEAEKELADLLGRKVDLVEKKNVINPFRRHHILTNRQVVYAA